MGRKEILKLFKIEREIDKDVYLNTKQIEEGLKNLGNICRTEKICKDLNELEKLEVLKSKKEKKQLKKYKINNKCKLRLWID